MATALASLATGIAVRGNVAMTGEITLRGRVLPVGGVREKVLAALRAGITRIILPHQCMAEARDIPKDIQRRLHFVPVTHMREVLEAALCSPPNWRSSEAHPVMGGQSAVHANLESAMQKGVCGGSGRTR